MTKPTSAKAASATPDLRKRAASLRADLARTRQDRASREGVASPDAQAIAVQAPHPSGMGGSVADLGRQLQRAQIDYGALDERATEAAGSTSLPEIAARERAELLMRRLNDRAEALREAISHGRAETLADALAQVVVVGTEAETLKSEAATSDAATSAARVWRIAFSLCDCIATCGGLDGADYGAEILMPASLDTLSPDFMAAEVAALLGSRAGGPPGFPRPPGLHTAERRLTDIDAQVQAWAEVYAEAGEVSAKVGRSGGEDEAARVMVDMATRHALRISRALLIQSVSVPATTVRELGLQARAVAAELADWWDDEDLPPGETVCRTLLDRLMGLASLSPVGRPDVTPAEVRDWLARPEVHAPRYYPKQGRS